MFLIEKLHVSLLTFVKDFQGPVEASSLPPPPPPQKKPSFKKDCYFFIFPFFLLDPDLDLLNQWTSDQSRSGSRSAGKI
jgi:hypothetical protein